MAAAVATGVAAAEAPPPLLYPELWNVDPTAPAFKEGVVRRAWTTMRLDLSGSGTYILSENP
jgi:hypothetical protein